MIFNPNFKYKTGDEEINGYAWWPTQLKDGKWVWLEHLRIKRRWWVGKSGIQYCDEEYYLELNGTK